MAEIRFPKQDIEGIRNLLSSPKRIVITTHHKPDGDAMGSSLGLYNYLIQKGHDVTVVTPNDCPEFLIWMPGQDKVIDYEKDPGTAKQKIAEAGVIFCLDFNHLGRIEGLEPFVKEAKAVKILIDHHLSPQDFCQFLFSYSEAAATSELICQFIDALGDQKYINKKVAESLYTGIMTDTASFRFATMLPETHRIVARLIEAGAENHKIHEWVYDSFSEDRLRFVSYCISNKMKVFPEYKTALISITREEMNRYNHTTGDTEGIVNMPLNIRGIIMAALFVERKDAVKMSFRSKGNFSVKDFAVKHFEGGGHKNAAGGKSSEKIDACVERFISLLPSYKEELLKS